MEEFIAHPRWMRDLPDSTPVTMVNIPGTHDSCCVDGLLGFGQTQELDLPDQLEAGIRFLDVRLAHYQDNLFVHHDVLHLGKNYKDVLATCVEFLERNPSEFILLSVKDESRFDSALGRFAPSEVLGRSRGNRANWVVRSDCFEAAFTARTWENVADATLFYNFPAPGRNRSVALAELTSRTTVGDVRGKIVLLRRFEGGPGVGMDLTHWPENQCFRSTTTPLYDIEDRYRHPGEEEKYRFVVEHLEAARCGDPAELFITFSSAVNLKPAAYSNVINPRLYFYLATCGPGRLGIIVMDYFRTPRELVTGVIRSNFRTGRVSGRADGVGKVVLPVASQPTPRAVPGDVPRDVPRDVLSRRSRRFDPSGG